MASLGFNPPQNLQAAQDWLNRAAHYCAIQNDIHANQTHDAAAANGYADACLLLEEKANAIEFELIGVDLRAMVDPRVEQENDIGIAMACCPGVDVPGVGRTPVRSLPASDICPGCGCGPDQKKANYYRCSHPWHRDAQAAERDRQLGALVFAANDLAEKNILIHSHGDGSVHRWCRECQASALGDRILHQNTCATGRVARIIASLLELVGPKGGVR